jgi:polyphosphate kinase 2 (PPK2 family)
MTATTNATTEKLPKKIYEQEMLRLQRELVEMQEWVRSSGARLVVVFEGRDAAGKGGAIQRAAEYLNPRVCRIVALPAPSERQRTQRYFQRYIEHLPRPEKSCCSTAAVTTARAWSGSWTSVRPRSTSASCGTARSSKSSSSRTA